MQKMTSLLTKSALGFTMIISLAACSPQVQQIEVSAKPVKKPELVLPPVDQLNMRKVEWTVLNADNIDEKLAKLISDGKPFGLFVLTGEGYENLGLNFSDIRAMVQQQQKIILAYENYYKEVNDAIDDANKERVE